MAVWLLFKSSSGRTIFRAGLLDEGSSEQKRGGGRSLASSYSGALVVRDTPGVFEVLRELMFTNAHVHLLLPNHYSRILCFLL